MYGGRGHEGCDLCIYHYSEQQVFQERGCVDVRTSLMFRCSYCWHLGVADDVLVAFFVFRPKVVPSDPFKGAPSCFKKSFP